MSQTMHHTHDGTGGLLGGTLSFIVTIFTSRHEGVELMLQALILGAIGAAAGYYMNKLLRWLHGSKKKN